MEADPLKKFEGFSKLNYEERLNRLLDLGFLSLEDISRLKSGAVSKKAEERVDLSESLIENALGYFPLPLGLAVNFVIDKKAFAIPLAVEETSIIAAASKTARWVCRNGEIRTQTLNSLSTGQIQIPKVENESKLRACVEKNLPEWRDMANANVLSSMVRRGGGMREGELSFLKRPDGGLMAVLRVLYRDLRGYGREYCQSGLRVFKALP